MEVGKEGDGRRMARGSVGKSYACAFAWPDDCFVQCGAVGVVFSSKGNYRTAFFEAFPKNPDTFLRGEGDTIEGAEKAAWSKYIKQSKCSHPEFERRGYTNGAAFCIQCGLFSSKHFEPTTECHKCGAKTNWSRDLNDVWICEGCDDRPPRTFSEMLADTRKE